MRDFLYISIIFSIFVVLSYIIGAYVPDIEGIFFALKHKDTALPYYDHNGHNSPDEGLSKGRGGIPFLLPPQNLNAMLKNSSGDIVVPALEIWKDIEGFEGFYQISNLKRVRSLGFLTSSNIKHNSSIYRKGRVLKPILKNTGYYSFNLCKNGVRQMKDLHRIFAEAFLPNPENKPEINHINGIKTDNNLSNLEWVTRKENALHAYKTNLMPGIKTYYGEENPVSKLNNAKVREIKRMLKMGIMQTQIAKTFAVNPSTIKAIKQNKTWKQVQYTI